MNQDQVAMTWARMACVRAKSLPAPFEGLQADDVVCRTFSGMGEGPKITEVAIPS